MNARPLHDKEFIAGLVEVVSQGISKNCLDDAQAVVACLRALRPSLAELDTFDGWIAIKRGSLSDAIHILRNVGESAQSWPLSKALLAYCECATGDSGWTASANDVLENSPSPEAVLLVRMLVDADTVMAEYAQPEAGATTGGAPIGMRA